MGRLLGATVQPDASLLDWRSRSLAADTLRRTLFGRCLHRCRLVGATVQPDASLLDWRSRSLAAANAALLRCGVALRRTLFGRCLQRCGVVGAIVQPDAVLFSGGACGDNRASPPFALLEPNLIHVDQRLGRAGVVLDDYALYRLPADVEAARPERDGIRLP